MENKKIIQLGAYNMSDRVLETRLYIDGQFQEAAHGGTFDVVNPSTGETITHLQSGTADDVDRAVQAAHRQFETGEWSRMDGVERARLLYRLADLIERDAEYLARLETMDNGKLYAMALGVDVPNTVATFRYFAGWADKLEGRTIPAPDAFGRPTFSYTIREPLGVIGAISAYNCPTMYIGWKAAPALAAGNTVVLKSAEEAPLSTLHVAHLFDEAGFPPGVFNVISGLGPIAGSALVRHELVAKISYTGGGRVGRIIAKEAADTLKPLTLELGGKAPQIVLDDADLEQALPILALGVFANQGQICAAGTRILVQRRIADKVADALSSAAKAQVVGDPFEKTTTMGPLTTSRSVERVMGYVEAGKREGARLLAGGKRFDRPGFFVEPAIFLGDNDQLIAREEIFGPVATIMPFDTLDEAVAIANDTEFGLNAGVFTTNLSTANLVARRMRAGAVWINGWALVDPRLPWGGIKGSGYGRENGQNALHDLTHEKVVTALL